MTKTVESAFADYLDQVRSLADGLPPGVRTELIAGISEFFREASATGQATDLESAHTLIERLGDPEIIVREAQESDPVGARYHRSRLSAHGGHDRWLDTWVVVLLTVGSFFGFVGWLAGVWIVWNSSRWRWGSRVLAALVVPGGPLGALFASLWISGRTQVICSYGVGGSTDGPHGPILSTVVSPWSCTSPPLAPWAGATLVVLLLVASVAGPLFVLRQARGRR